METEIVCFSRVLDLLFGNNNFRAFGLTRVEVSIKKISNKKTISVIEDILKFGLTLFLLLSAITHYDVIGLKILLFSLLIENHFINFTYKIVISNVCNDTNN